MSEPLERAIRDMLITEGNTDKVARLLLKRLAAESPGRKERIVFSQFLIHAGYCKETLEIFAAWFKKKTPIPLRLFCSLLHKAGFKPGIDFLNPFFQAHDEGGENRLEHFSPWEPFDNRFIQLRAKTEQLQSHGAAQRKEKLIEKLAYLRTNRMIDEEEKLLNELIRQYPEDPNFKDEKASSRENWARAIIARRAFAAFDKEMIQATPPSNPEEQRAAAGLIDEMKRLAQERPAYAYDFAVGLYFLDLFDRAQELLALTSPARHADWLSIELLIRSRRFVECLDAVATVEVRYAEDPETAFGATYYRALALEGLGQVGTASDLLKSIVAIRPSYRSAHALLMKWTSL